MKTEKILNAKHWQVFLFIFGIFLLFSLLVIGILIYQYQTNQSNTLFEFQFFYLRYLPFIVLGLTVPSLFWFWAVGVGINNLLPQINQIDLSLFKKLIFIPAIGYPLIAFVAPSSIFHVPYLFIIILMIILKWLSRICVIYCIYILSRTIKTMELKKNLEFKDYLTEFVLILFLPVGIWFIQPKINKLIERNENKSIND